ncbi:MAG: DUF2779 domain-containing protein [Burkholderiales bacterium]|nr:MAG: DUF2779 domain-containing protein [Burkholderiales bacterium]
MREFRLVQGHQVGTAARALFPDGRLIGTADDPLAALEATRDGLSAQPPVPLFEAAFAHAGVRVRADLLLPERGRWVLAEVKSSSGIREHQLDDVAIQRWVLGASGLELARAQLWHVDTRWTYAGDGDYSGLFNRVDVEAETLARAPRIAAAAAQAQPMLAGPEPRIATGAHCDQPFACPFQDHCASAPAPQPRYPVTLLPHNKGKRLAAELLAEGYADLREVPAARIRDPELSMIHRVTRSGRAHLDPAARALIGSLPYPRAFLDFETVALAVPRWAGTRPYEQIAFQWSCHVQHGDGTVRHGEYLDASGQDPRRGCARALVQTLPCDGPILVYNAPFERGVLQQLARFAPDLARPLHAAAERLVDLLPVVRDHYYHRDMLGSRSIKRVLPTLGNGLDHAALDEVADGAGAQLAYLEAIDTATRPARRAELERKLGRYCALDTEALLALAQFLGSAR